MLFIAVILLVAMDPVVHSDEEKLADDERCMETAIENDDTDGGKFLGLFKRKCKKKESTNDAEVEPSAKNEEMCVPSAPVESSSSQLPGESSATRVIPVYVVLRFFALILHKSNSTLCARHSLAACDVTQMCLFLFCNSTFLFIISLEKSRLKNY